MVEKHDRLLIGQEDEAERSRLLVEVLQSWQRPLNLLSSQALDDNEAMDQARTTKISEWLSSVRVDAHHAAIREEDFIIWEVVAATCSLPRLGQGPLFVRALDAWSPRDREDQPYFYSHQ